jgi:hypothetical protein
MIRVLLNDSLLTKLAPAFYLFGLHWVSQSSFLLSERVDLLPQFLFRQRNVLPKGHAQFFENAVNVVFRLCGEGFPAKLLNAAIRLGRHSGIVSNAGQ